MPTSPSTGRRGGFDAAIDLSAPPDALSRIGGASRAREIVRAFYARIQLDPHLARVFPHFLTSGVESFFVEWLGGGGFGDDPWARGVRLRHFAIHITPSVAARWIELLGETFASEGLDAALRQEISSRLEPVAAALAHVHEPAPGAADEPLERSCQGTRAPRMQALEALRKAARKGDARAIERALAENESFARERGLDGGTILWDAAGAGKAPIVELALGAGADVDMPASTSFVVDIACAKRGAPGTIVAISPYAHARSRRRRAVADLLLAAGARRDVFTCAYLDDIELLTAELEREPELVHAHDPADDYRPVTALHHAVCGGSFASAALLVARGAEVASHSGFLLTVAARLDRLDLVTLFLESGADARETSVLGPLDPPERPIADLLVKRGFDVNAAPFWGAMLARICRPDVSTNEVHRAQVLLAYGADPNLLGPTGLGPLHYAVRGGNTELASLLLATGARVDLPDKEGLVPLDHLEKTRARFDPTPMVELLQAAARE